MTNTAIDGIAEYMGVTSEEVMANPSMIEGQPQVAVILSQTFGIPVEYIESQLDDISEFEGQYIPSAMALVVMVHGLDHYMQGAPMDDLMLGVYAAAEYLDMEVVQLMTQLNLIENDPSVLAVASEASGLDEKTLMAFIRVQLAEAELVSVRL